MGSLLGCVDTLDRHIPMFSYIGSGGIEAINFQKNSKLPRDLISLFDKVFTMISKWEQRHGEVTNPKEALEKHTAIKEFILKDIGPDLIKVIKQHTGISVLEFISVLPTSSSAVLDVWAWLAGSDELTVNLIKSAKGISESDYNDVPDNSLSQVLRANTSLDKAKGKILSDVKELQIKIGIPVGIFVIKDFMPKSYHKYQPTSTELAAGILHEIGHIFGYIEYMADLSYTGYYGSNILRDMDQKFNSNPKKAIADIKKLTKKKSANKKVVVLTEVVTGLLTKLSDSSKIDAEDGYSAKPNGEGPYDREDPNTSYSNNTKRVFTSLLINIITFIIYSGFIPITWLISPMVVSSKPNASSRERISNIKGMTMYERLADEYVSRFKMSKHLNRILMKTDAITKGMSSSGYDSPVFSKSIRDNRAIRAFTITTKIPRSIFLALVFAIMSDSSTYERTLLRHKRNIANTRDLLKDNTLPASIRHDIVKEVDDMEKELKAIEPELSSTISKLVSMLASLPRTITQGILDTILGSGGVNSDYKVLLEKLEKLTSNRAYYYSSKIMNIFDKK